ncbi:MAG: hypothetical protein U1F23_09245 [Lysobacterales bacterium]
MRLAIIALAASPVILAAGCATNAPVRRVVAPAVSVQELVQKPGDVWNVTLRVQNYSTVTMHYVGLHATLEVAGRAAGVIDESPRLDIPSGSADVVHTILKAPRPLPAGDVPYKVYGSIKSHDPDGEKKFEYSGWLSPTPGLADTWR